MSTYNFVNSIIPNQMNIIFSLDTPTFGTDSVITIVNTSTKILNSALLKPTINDLPLGIIITANNNTKKFIITYNKTFFIKHIDATSRLDKISNNKFEIIFTSAFAKCKFIMEVEFDFGISNGEPNDGWDFEKVIEPTSVYSAYRVSIGEAQSVSSLHISGGMRLDASSTELHNGTFKNYMNHVTDTGSATTLIVNLDKENLVDGREINLVNIKGSVITKIIKIETRLNVEFDEAIEWKQFSSFPKDGLIKCLYKKSTNTWLVGLTYLDSSNLDKSLTNTKTVETTQTTKRANSDLSLDSIIGYDLKSILISDVSYEDVTDTKIYELIKSSTQTSTTKSSRTINLLLKNLVSKSAINLLNDYLLIYNPTASKNLKVPLALKFKDSTLLLTRKLAFNADDPYQLQVKLDGVFTKMNTNTDVTSINNKLDAFGITITPYFQRKLVSATDSIIIGDSGTLLSENIYTIEDRDMTDSKLLYSRRELGDSIALRYYANNSFNNYIVRHRQLDYYRTNFWSGTSLNVSDKFLIYDSTLTNMTSFKTTLDKSIYRNYNYVSATDIRATNVGDILYTVKEFSNETSLNITLKNIAFLQTQINTSGISLTGLDEVFIIDCRFNLVVTIGTKTLSVTGATGELFQVIIRVTIDTSNNRISLLGDRNILYGNPTITYL